MKKRMLVGLVTVIVVLGGLAYRLCSNDGGTWMTAPAGSAPQAPGAGAERAAGSAVPAAFVTGLEGLPPSLRGSEVDAELEVDAAGHLRITAGIRRLFDYFLSAVGEEPPETVIARIRAWLGHKLPAVAAAEAGRLLDSYVAYKRGLDTLPQASQGGGQPDVEALRRQLQQVQALRLQFFTPEVVAAFFGDEDAYDRYTLERISLLQDTSLSPIQRAARLAGLDGQLPAGLRESLRVVNQVQNLDAVTRDWKARGGSPAELRQIRETLVGTEATDRLEVFDRENAQWQARMDSWLAERAAILANRNLSEQDRQAQLESLRISRFSEPERLRVQALEHMHDRGEG